MSRRELKLSRRELIFTLRELKNEQEGVEIE